MSSVIPLTQPAAVAQRRTLVAQTVPPASLDARTLDAAFAVFRSAYDNVSRERFEHDLNEKQFVILLRDRETGQLKGFSTVLVQSIASPDGPATVFFSGDTVIDRAYWGQKQLQLAAIRLLVRTKLRAPTRPVYWFLLSKGYRTYLILANAFPRSVPRVDRPDDAELRRVLDRLATERYGDQYDPATGLIRYSTPHEHVRDGVTPVTPALLENPHIRFFVARNPEHATGVELACLADVRLQDLARAAFRFAVTLTRRRLKLATVSTG